MNKMDIEKFSDLIDRCGVETEHWPIAERSSAEAFLAVNDAALDIVTRARQFDIILGQDATIAASPQLKSQILAAAPGAEAAVAPITVGWGRLWPFGPIWRPVATLACATVLGIYVGIADPISIFGDQTVQASVPSDMILLSERSGFGLEEVE